ncbi:MAG: glycosyl hydrolase family 18 protein [Candidatus Pacebacteria bacterium]|nr:glycosyl hydrolase family 18 protein [Candidatus Paceibacterota bacterium]
MKKLFYTLFICSFVFVATPAFAKSESIFYYFPNEEGYESLQENYRDIDIFAPQTYTVGYDLRLMDRTGNQAHEFARKKRMDVMPLVIQANFDKALMTRLLKDEDAQEDLIDDLIDEAKDNRYIGWQFDFENINYLDRDAYVDFVEKASKEFKKKRLEFSVAVIPSTVPFDPYALTQDWSSGYDIEAIGEHVDFISLMSYDDPRSTGPVSSIQYLERVVNETLEKIDAEKISMGIPMYCWQYELGNPKKIANVTYPTSYNTLEKYKDTLAINFYSDIHEAEIFLFLKDKLNIIWCDNARSFEAKLDFIDEYDMRGFSAWALGQEDENIWKQL